MNGAALKTHILMGFAGLLVVSRCLAQDLAKGEKDTVYIGNLQIQPSVRELAAKSGRELELKRVAESLDTQFINALNATRVFQIVERKRVSDVQEEQAFAAVNVDPNDKNAAQALKMAGAKYVFLPQIDGFEDRSETQEYQQIGRSSMARTLFFSVVVQVVDTTTGKLLPDSPSIQLNKSEAVQMARTGAGTAGSDQILVELAKEMAGKLSQGVVSLLRPAKVLTVTGKQLLVNRGTEAGFNKGDLIELYGVEEVKDEDTGETFRNEVPVGQAKIARGDAKQSFAMIQGDDMGIAKGCVARVIQPAAVTAPAQSSGAGSAPGASLNQQPATPRDCDLTPGSSEKPLKFD
jgi:curli biogenesis system outer membrane secretion channel CsgG